MVYDPQTGAVYCHKCGAENEFEAPYCTKCGFPLKTYARPDRESRWSIVIIFTIAFFVLVLGGFAIYDSIFRHIFPVGAPIGVLIGMGIFVLFIVVLVRLGYLTR